VFTGIRHDASIGLTIASFHRQAVDAAVMIRERTRGILGSVACSE
jgi:hypothetical protein